MKQARSKERALIGVIRWEARREINLDVKK
jgi:hypothetical protein